MKCVICPSLGVGSMWIKSACGSSDNHPKSTHQIKPQSRFDGRIGGRVFRSCASAAQPAHSPSAGHLLSSVRVAHATPRPRRRRPTANAILPTTEQAGRRASMTTAPTAHAPSQRKQCIRSELFWSAWIGVPAAVFGATRPSLPSKTGRHASSTGSPASPWPPLC